MKLYKVNITFDISFLFVTDPFFKCFLLEERNIDIKLVNQELTHDQLGFDINTELPADITPEDEKDISKVIQQIRGSIRRPPGRFEAIPDNMTPEQIATQARNAANSAAERLHKRKPGSNMGYLRQKADGTTSLAFITPAMAAAGGDKTVTLGQLIGRVKNGASTLQGFKEDRRNCVL